MMEAIELWHDKKKSWFEKIRISSDDALTIRSHHSLISAGTERVVTTHEMDSNLAERMAVPFMKGSLDNAFTYGYSLVGEVLSEGEYQGKWVHVMHPHQDMLVVRKEDVYVLPDRLNPKIATLISNMETAVNAVWDAKIELGDRVLIQGYGVIGALVASILQRYPGLDFVVSDKDPRKAEWAASHGLQIYNMDERDFDVIFNATSSEQALQDALSLTRLEGSVVELSWYGNESVNLNLGADFHHGRKRLICSQVSHIPFRKQPLWNYKNRKDLVVRLLQELNPEHLIGHEISFQETPEFYDKLRSGDIKELSTIINYH